MTQHNELALQSQHTYFLKGNVAFKRTNLNYLEYKKVERMKAVFLSLLRLVSLLCQASQNVKTALTLIVKLRVKIITMKTLLHIQKLSVCFKKLTEHLAFRNNEARARFSLY